VFVLTLIKEKFMKNVSRYLIALALAAMSLGSWAAFPTKTVKIIISLPVGSGPDLLARRATEVLSEKWNQPVVVDNRPGASGLIAMDTLLKEPADGHAVAIFSVGDIVAFPILHNRPELINNIEPLVPFFTADMMLFTSSQIKTIVELRQEIQKNPMYGSWAVGSIGHVAGAEFGSTVTPGATHVPYKEYGAWYIDTSNRVLSYGFTSPGSGNAMYRSGKIHYLAIAANRRDPNFPDVPTMRELTGENIVAQSWLAFYVNQGVNEATKRRLETDIREAIATPRVQNMISNNYFIPLNHLSLNEFRKQIAKDKENYVTVLNKHKINIKP
jgi:tripartite-type tricarboxylate transporter receptor subunit TctC